MPDKPGRPPKQAWERKRLLLQIRITEDDHAILTLAGEIASQRTGASMSGWIRSTLTQAAKELINDHPAYTTDKAKRFLDDKAFLEEADREEPPGV